MASDFRLVSRGGYAADVAVCGGTDLLTSNMMYHTLPFLTHPDRNVQLSTMSKVPLPLRAIAGTSYLRAKRALCPNPPPLPTQVSDSCVWCQVWAISFTGNLLGSVAIAWAMSSYVFLGDPWQSWLAALAVKKTSMPFDEEPSCSHSLHA